MQRERHAVPLCDFLAILGILSATFIRDLEYLRERLNAATELIRGIPKHGPDVEVVAPHTGFGRQKHDAERR